MIAALNVVTNATRAARRDPTRSAGLRREYGLACQKRFRSVKRLIIQTVKENDAFGLEPRRGGLGIVLQAAATNAAIPARRYDFPSDPAGKASAFMDWLMDSVDQEILEIEERDGRKISGHSAWQNLYVRTAYTKGIAHADRLLGWEGISKEDLKLWQIFQQPIHANTLAMLYTRNFDELKGVTEAMGQAIARSLTDGMARGWGMAKMARALTGHVDGIGIRRAWLLARTEVVRAFAEATLNRFEEAGVETVGADVELVTAGDLRVCPVCKSLNGKIYTIQEARGLIPVHPQCRCAWVPVLMKNNRWILASR